jgi:Gnt-I system high-affinity gluconate transporter
MPLVIVAVGVILLLIMMTKFRLNGFIALILVAILVGLLQGMGLTAVYESIVDGIGGQLDDLVMILGFGAMLGKLMADSGAAQRIAMSMLKVFGISRVQLAMVLTAFAIGITMFYEVGFVLLIPLVFTIVREAKLPLLWVGLPMSIALSTMHSFLPPHPGPAAVAGTFDASMGLTLFYGLFIAIPAAALIAFTWPRLPFIKKMNPAVPYDLITTKEFEEDDMPSFFASLGIAMIPVILMGTSAIATIAMSEENPAYSYIMFFGESPIALLVALLVAIPVLGPGAGRSLDDVAKSCNEAVKPMAMIILVIAGGGAFKQVLVDSGIAEYIAELTSGWNVSPLILAWGIAVLLRIALGSATVAVVTAAGVVLPLVATSGVAPELMVLAVSCGSIAFSHVNDPGFWLFKEYFNLSVIEAIKTRTTYTTALSILGIGGIRLMNLVIGAPA